MRVDDFVTSSEDVQKSFADLAHSETKNAVNTGIVETAHKSEKVLKEDVLTASHKGSSAAQLGKAAKNTLLDNLGSEEKLSKIQRAGQYTAKAIKAKVIHNTLEGSEFEGMDDMYYRAKAGYKVAQAAGNKTANKFDELRKKRKAHKDVSDGANNSKNLGKLSEKKYKRKLSPDEIQHQIQGNRNQAKAQKAAKTAREVSKSTKKAFVAATKRTSTSFALLSGGMSGLVAPILGGIGALIATLILVAVIVAGANNESPSLNEVENKVVAFFREKGLDDIHIAAIMGNMKAESGMDPARHQDGGSAIGLCQWDGGRKDRLLAFSSEMGVPWTNLDLQLKFFWERDSWDSWSGSYSVSDGSTDPPAGTYVSGSKAGFDATDDVAQATREFCYGWERAGIPHITPRIENAQGYLAALRNGSLGNGEFTNPCPEGTVSSPFGWRDGGEFHKGLDLAAPEGTPTYAAADGTVTIAGWSDSAGNWVVIDHGGGLVTKYMHHSALVVSAGQHVSKGQQIGLVGNTGNSFGAHLHFQVEINGDAVDPQGYL